MTNRAGFAADRRNLPARIRPLAGQDLKLFFSGI